jgi:hypothetical protein
MAAPDAMASKRIDARLRGVALVERAIDALPIRAPKPVPAEVLATLTLGGKPLPPSLRRWLAHHAALPRPYATKLLEGEGLTPSPWGAIAHRALARGSFGLGELGAILPGRMLPLDVGDEQFRVLFVGEPDAAGEYPVLDVDVGWGPTVTLALPGFDVWLAVVAGLVPAAKGRAMHRAAIAEHARRNMAGAEGWEKLAEWTPHPTASWEPPPFPKPNKNKAMDAPTELVWAAREGEIGAVRELLDDGVSASARPEGCVYGPPIHAAANCAHPSIMELLIERGAPVDQRDHESLHRTPLHVIAGMDWWWYAKAEPQLLDRWLACARLLLARGANIEARDGYERTPIQLAAGRRSLPLVALLVEGGADVNARTRRGGNALHELLAIPLGRKTQPAHDVVACLKLLLASGIDRELANELGETPVALATKDPGMPKEVVALLSTRPSG